MDTDFLRCWCFHQQTGVSKNHHKVLIVISSTTNYMYQHDIQFFTATILWWKHPLKPDKYKQIIMDSMKFLVKHQRVRIYGFVFM